VRTLAGPLLCSRIQHVRLQLNRSFSRSFGPLLNRFLPYEKLAIYGDNLDFFRSLDALVVTESTSSVSIGRAASSRRCEIARPSWSIRAAPPVPT